MKIQIGRFKNAFSQAFGSGSCSLNLDNRCFILTFKEIWKGKEWYEIWFNFYPFFKVRLIVKEYE